MQTFFCRQDLSLVAGPHNDEEIEVRREMSLYVVTMIKYMYEKGDASRYLEWMKGSTEHDIER